VRNIAKKKTTLIYDVASKGLVHVPIGLEALENELWAEGDARELILIKQVRTDAAKEIRGQFSNLRKPVELAREILQTLKMQKLLL